MEFMREFPDDETCLDWLWRPVTPRTASTPTAPSASSERMFKRYATAQQRQSWTCTACGQHVHPTAGTIFHKSSTSLHLWFYAMYLMTSTRCGISAKQLERELGVTYKTAWRMFHLIRNELMDQDDETRCAARSRWTRRTWAASPARTRSRPSAEHCDRKAAVFGVVERGGRVARDGRCRAGAVEARAPTSRLVKADALVYTDDSAIYDGLDRSRPPPDQPHREGLRERNVHTQTIEGFFSTREERHPRRVPLRLRQCLQGYLNEYAWRYNHRDDDRGTFRFLARSLIA